MRIRFNISPSGETELALIALIEGYPDGLKSELVRRLLVVGYQLHSSDADILSGINFNAEPSNKGIMCILNISSLVPEYDPIMKVFNRAKHLNSLVKPLYLNKLIKSGYLFETGKTTSHIDRKSEFGSLEVVNSSKNESIPVLQGLNEYQLEAPLENAIKQSAERQKNRLSLRDNQDLKNSLKNLSS